MGLAMAAMRLSAERRRCFGALLFALCSFPWARSCQSCTTPSYRAAGHRNCAGCCTVGISPAPVGRTSAGTEDISHAPGPARPDAYLFPHSVNCCRLRDPLIPRLEPGCQRMAWAGLSTCQQAAPAGHRTAPRPSAALLLRPPRETRRARLGPPVESRLMSKPGQPATERKFQVSQTSQPEVSRWLQWLLVIVSSETSVS